ncbi:MAG: GNAT family N-acetyltransferase [Ahrensia sp.]|nr:GNAT family N-acetyltransferase [Ahrensia sp.]
MDILITKRLTLRPPLEVDTETITLHLQNERVARFLTGVPANYALDDARTWIERTMSDPDIHNFTIHSNVMMGVVGLRSIEDRPDFGYWLAEPFWGRGYMSEAAEAVLRHMFARYDFNEIASGAYQDNPASHRVLEKLGFVPTDETHQHFCPTRGCEVPCNRVSLTRAGFEARFGAVGETKAA